MLRHASGSGDNIIPDGIRDLLHDFLGHVMTMPNNLEQVKPRNRTLALCRIQRTLKAMPTSSEHPFADIGARLKWHRELLGLDQAAYVTRTKTIKRTAYSNWEVGATRLSLNGAMELVDAYGLSLDFLYFGNVDTLPMALRSAWMSKSHSNA